MKNYKTILILGLLLVVLAGPILYHLIPQYNLTPDVLFIKAKAMWVSGGELYNDPVTGYPTFHPPYYHLFLSLFLRLGIGIEFLLISVSIVNVGLLMMFVYLILRRVFDDRTALATVFMLPFISQYMGPNYLFLASSFSFSLSFFMAGLWLYIREKSTKTQDILTAVLWGCAFLISPGYLFLIAFTFAYELIFKKRLLRFGIMSGVFLLVIIPFFYQFYSIRSLGLMEMTVFSWWRGFPDAGWMLTLIREIISPLDGSLDRWQLFPMFLLAGTGLFGIWRMRPVNRFPAIAGLAYLFTYYHFNNQYASRILFFVSLFIAAYGVSFLFSLVSKKRLIIIIVSLFVLMGLGDHVVRMIQFYDARMERYTLYGEQMKSIREGLGDKIESGDFILADAKTYRRYIMPHFPAHGLMAYKSGEYFQLNSTLSNDMLKDYTALMQTRDRAVIEHICNKYRMEVAVLSKVDNIEVVFSAIDKWWDLKYESEYFKIYGKPARRANP